MAYFVKEVFLISITLEIRPKISCLIATIKKVFGGFIYEVKRFHLKRFSFKYKTFLKILY